DLRDDVVAGCLRERLRLDPEARVGARTGDGDDLWGHTGGDDRGANVGDRVTVARELEDVAALEVDRRMQAADEDAQDADEHHDSRTDVPHLASSDEVVGDLAAVQPRGEGLTPLA